MPSGGLLPHRDRDDVFPKNVKLSPYSDVYNKNPFLHLHFPDDEDDDR